MTEEEKAEVRAFNRARYAAMSPEERLAFSEKQREYRQRRLAKMTPEQLEEHRARRREYQRQYQRKRRARMSEEELEVFRKRHREYMLKSRNRKANDQG